MEIEFHQNDVAGHIDISDRSDFCFGDYPSFRHSDYEEFLNGIRTSSFIFDEPVAYVLDRFKDQPAEASYFDDMDEFINQVGAGDQEFAVQFGDMRITQDFPIFVKCREVGSKAGVITNLNSRRHWAFWGQLKNDMPWSEKKDDIIWRGVATGYAKEESPRYILVSKFIKECDVGFSHQIEQSPWLQDELVVGCVDVEDQLKRKFILSVEGNDVATNLKWILASNSVPIMPHPTVESWLMESKLVPYVHYVPVKSDFSDLLDIVEWCRTNDQVCETIARNGKTYMTQFTKDTQAAVYRGIYKRFLDLLGRD